MTYIITLDIGTTSVKTSLFDEKFNLKALVSNEYELVTPEKDIVEMDPEVYWCYAVDSIRKVIAETGIPIEEVKVITVATQGETIIAVDDRGNPLYNALVWLDARAVEEAQIATEIIGHETYYRSTGLPEIGPANPLCKVLWFKRNRPDIYCKVFKFLLLEDFIIHRLTGEFVTENSLMSSTGYFDINRNCLWNEGLEKLGMKKEIFPSILSCGKQVGRISDKTAGLLGLSPATMVSTGAMDQICSAIGAGNVKPGIITETTGTALVIAATLEKPDFDHPAQVTYYRHCNGNFLLLPYCPTAGIVLKWFRDEFCREEIEKSRELGIHSYELLDEMASHVSAVSDGLLLLPHFSGKLSPENNAHAKGVLYGIGLDTRKEHVIRAILESIGYMLRENIEMLEQLGISVKEIRSIGGGAKSGLWNQIKADICGKTISTMQVEESTSLGAAILGAVSIGLYGTVHEACNCIVRVNKTYTPSVERREIYEKNYRVYKLLYERLKDI